MREMFTTQEAYGRDISPKALRHGERSGRWRRVAHGIYALGPGDPTALDRAVAEVVVTGGVARGRLAGTLHGLDSVRLGGPDARRSAPAPAPRRRGGRPAPPPDRLFRVGRLPCTDGFQTLVDLAATLDDATWEQALESALRKKIVSVDDLKSELCSLGRTRTRGVARIRRVLSMRPAGTPPTESLLETLMVQLIRRVPGLPEPTRQFEVFDEHDRFVARVDLAWPEIGLFIELDGQHHKDQPVHDARRETAIVAATGWLCGRFTWTEVTRHPSATARRLAALADQARRRPLAS